jgi:hypothetical protein
MNELSELFKLVEEEKKRKKEEYESLVGDLGLDSIFEEVSVLKTKSKIKNKKGHKALKVFEDLLSSREMEPNIEEEIEEIFEVVEELQEELEKPKQPTLIERSLGLLAEPSNTKVQQDPLTPLDQKFATLEDLEKHYKLFLNRIQQQLSTIGGGGETKLRYLDDVVGVATNSAAYDGAFLRWNSSTNTAGFSTYIGGLLINETLDTVTDRGNTTTNGIGVSFVNLPVGSVISGLSSIVANITRANLSSVLEYGPYANLGIGSYGLTYGITGVNYAVYELQVVPSPTLQIGDVIAGAGISVGSAIIGIGTGAYNKVIITDKTFPVGAGVSPIPYGTIINFARAVVNPGLSIATQDFTDITLNAGASGNVVTHSDILPYVTNVWSLGSPARRFKEIWFGTGTIYVQDETLGNDQALGAKDGNFYIKGGAGLEVGEWVLRDNEIRIKDSTRDVYIGSLGATADVVFNRSVKIQDSSNRTAYYTDRTGRTQYYPPTIPAGDIGGVSIIGSTNGAYQPIVNSGGMLHITGNDGAVSRITNDAWGTGVFPAYVSRAGRGTAASPSASQSGDILSRYSSVGWGSTGFAGGLAANNIEVVARENFTNTAQSAEYRFYSAPIGSIAKTLDLRINTEGLSFVSAGSTTGITFYDNSRLTYFPSQTAATADKFLKVTNVAGNYVMSWETPPTITGAVIYKGNYNVVTNTPPITDGVGAGATAQTGWEYTVVGVGTTNFGSGNLTLQDGDLLIHNGSHYDLIPGPRTQLNSDWNATTGVTAILNKPNIVNQIIGGTGVSLSPVNGIGTVTINATGTQNLNSVLTNGNTSALGINVGVVSATSYTGNGVNLTGIVTSIVAGTGGITVSGSTGQVTINGTAQQNSDWTATVGVTSIVNKPTIVNQIVAGSGVSIAPTNGIGIVTVTTTYAPVAGIATYATSSGIATYATRAGIATYATSSGIATYATSAGIATYATSSGVSTSVIGGIGSITALTVSGITTSQYITITGSATTTAIPLNLTGIVTGAATSTGMISIGTLNFTDTNNLAVFADNVNNYTQFLVHNKNSGNSASSDIIVTNDLSGATNYYGDFGCNSSTFTGGGPFDDPNGVYVYASYGTLSIGTNDIDDFRIATGVTTNNPTTRLTVKGITGNVGIATTVPTAILQVGVGTAGRAPLKLTAGTNLSTAEAGAIEYDGTAFYSTKAAGSRGVVPSEQFVVLTGIHTLASQTAAQPLFDGDAGPPGGALYTETGTYFFECVFHLESMSNSNSSFGFALGGTATKTEGWQSFAYKSSTIKTPSSPGITWNTSENTTLISNSIGTQGFASIKGTVRVTVAGTIIPQVSLTAAAAATVQPNSYFKISPVGSATTTYVGHW